MSLKLSDTTVYEPQIRGGYRQKALEVGMQRSCFKRLDVYHKSSGSGEVHYKSRTGKGRFGPCEDRIGTGPPRARTEIIYVDLPLRAGGGYRQKAEEVGMQRSICCSRSFTSSGLSTNPCTPHIYTAYNAFI